MKVDVKYVIRFLKDEGIYKPIINILQRYKINSGDTDSYIKIIDYMYKVDTSCLTFFKWLRCYDVEDKFFMNNFGVPQLYACRFKMFLILNKINETDES